MCSVIKDTLMKGLEKTEKEERKVRKTEVSLEFEGQIDKTQRERKGEGNFREPYLVCKSQRAQLNPWIQFKSL